MCRRLSLLLLITLLCVQVAPALAAPQADITYIVQRGDTLYSIALRYGVTVTAIAKANGLTNTNLIYVGQRLIIPTATGGSTSPTSPPPVSGSTCGSVYIVQRGDTLYHIALKCGVSMTAIASANSFTNLNLIYVGQRLVIPGGGSGPAPTPIAMPTPITSSPTGTPAPALTHGITGKLTLCNPSKLTYATYERVCFNMLLTNQTAQPVSYTFLGLHAVSVSGGASVFHTSWSGALSIPAHGVGPTSSGWEDGLYLSPGSYKITLDICYAAENSCYQSIGWEVLTTGITVKTVS